MLDVVAPYHTKMLNEIVWLVCRESNSKRKLTTINPLFFYRDIKNSSHNTHGKFVTYSAIYTELKMKRNDFKKLYFLRFIWNFFVMCLK